jgi:hypothetical protein
MLTLPLKNSNRTMDLLNQTCLKGVPKMMAQENVKDAIAHLKFFIDSWTWYVTELDPKTGEAFGKVFSCHCPDGELGYIDMNELAQIRGSVGHGVERDRYFKPTPLSQCR